MSTDVHAARAFAELAARAQCHRAALITVVHIAVWAARALRYHRAALITAVHAARPSLILIAPVNYAPTASPAPSVLLQ